jgi:hypothetical protein
MLLIEGRKLEIIIINNMSRTSLSKKKKQWKMYLLRDNSKHSAIIFGDQGFKMKQMCEEIFLGQKLPTKQKMFNKRQRKNEESEWKREGTKTEEVNEFKYLGYTFNERATDQRNCEESK